MAQESSKQGALLAAVAAFCAVRRADRSIPQDAGTVLSMLTASADILGERGALLLKHGAFVQMALLLLAQELDQLNRPSGGTVGAADQRDQGKFLVAFSRGQTSCLGVGGRAGVEEYRLKRIHLMCLTCISTKKVPGRGEGCFI